MRADRDRRHRFCGCDRTPDLGKSSRLVRGHRPGLLRRVVRHDVQPHQGCSFCRRHGRRDIFPDPDSALATAASGNRCRRVRRPDGRSTRDASAGFAAADLCWLRHRALCAAPLARPCPRAMLFRGRFTAALVARDAACLPHHGHGLAVGRAGAAQPHSRVVRVLTVSL